jgi:hypothetical protein
MPTEDMGGFTFAQGLILIVTASMFAPSMANKDWPHKGGSHHPNKIIVGGSEGWRFNFSYTDWAIKNGPVYLNDTLGEFTIFLVLSSLRMRFKFY